MKYGYNIVDDKVRGCGLITVNGMVYRLLNDGATPSLKDAVVQAMYELRLGGISVSKIYVDKSTRDVLGPEVMTCQGPTELVVADDFRWECLNTFGAVVYDGLRRNEAELIARQHGLTARPKL